MMLKVLEDQPTYSKSVEVVNIDAPAKLSGGFRKQEKTIADSTAAARLTLWNDDINTLEEFNSYHFELLTV